MSNARLAVTFAIALGLLLIAGLPLRLALSLAGAERQGLAATSVTGSLWRGELKAARFASLRFDRVGMGIDPLGLLAAQRGLWFDADGPVEARGRLGGGGIEIASAAAPLTKLLPQAPFAGRLRLNDVDTAFKDGRCERASGQVQIDRLVLAGAGGGGELPGLVLRGPLACSGGKLTAQLSGMASGVSVEAVASFDAAGRYRLETHVRATGAGLPPGTRLPGFEQGLDGLARIDHGRVGA